MWAKRGGITTKIHARVTRKASGLPPDLAGEAHDVAPTSCSMGLRRCIVIADKAYDADNIRAHILTGRGPQHPEPIQSQNQVPVDQDLIANAIASSVSSTDEAVAHASAEKGRKEEGE